MPLTEFSYNDKIQMSTGFSPFYLNYGQHPWKSPQPQREVETEAAEVFAKQMKKIREEAVAVLEKAASDMKDVMMKGGRMHQNIKWGIKCIWKAPTFPPTDPRKSWMTGGTVHSQ